MVRNQRITTAWTARQDDNARRAAPACHPDVCDADPGHPVAVSATLDTS